MPSIRGIDSDEDLNNFYETASENSSLNFGNRNSINGSCNDVTRQTELEQSDTGQATAKRIGPKKHNLESAISAFIVNSEKLYQDAANGVKLTSTPRGSPLKSVSPVSPRSDVEHIDGWSVDELRERLKAALGDNIQLRTDIKRCNRSLAASESRVEQLKSVVKPFQTREELLQREIESLKECLCQHDKSFFNCSHALDATSNGHLVVNGNHDESAMNGDAQHEESFTARLNASTVHLSLDLAAENKRLIAQQRLIVADRNAKLATLQQKLDDAELQAAAAKAEASAEIDRLNAKLLEQKQLLEDELLQQETDREELLEELCEYQKMFEQVHLVESPHSNTDVAFTPPSPSKTSPRVLTAVDSETQVESADGLGEDKQAPPSDVDQNTIQALKLQVGDLDSQLTRLREISAQSLQTLSDQLKQMRHNMESLTKENADLAAKCRDLAKERQNALGNLKIAREDNDALAKRLNEVTLSRASIEGRAEILSQSLAASNDVAKSLAAAEEKLEAAQKTLSQRDQQLRESEVKLSRAIGELERLRDEAVDLRKGKDLIAEQTRQKELQIQTLKELLSNTKPPLEDPRVRNLLDAKDSQIGRLEGDKELLMSQVKAVQDVQKAFEMQKGALQNADFEVLDLKQKIVHLELILDEHLHEKEMLTRDRSTLSEQLAEFGEIKIKCQKQATTIKDLTDANADLKGAFEDWKKNAIAQFEHMRAEYEKRLDEVKAKLTSVTPIAENDNEANADGDQSVMQLLDPIIREQLSPEFVSLLCQLHKENKQLANLLCNSLLNDTSLRRLSQPLSQDSRTDASGRCTPQTKSFGVNVDLSSLRTSDDGAISSTNQRLADTSAAVREILAYVSQVQDFLLSVERNQQELNAKLAAPQEPLSSADETSLVRLQKDEDVAKQTLLPLLLDLLKQQLNVMSAVFSSFAQHAVQSECLEKSAFDALHEQVNSTLRKLHSEFEVGLGQLRHQQVISLEAQMKSLKEQTITAKRRLKEFMFAESELKANVESLKESLANKCAQEKEISLQLASHQKYTEALNAELDSSKKHSAASETRMKELTDEVQTLRKTIRAKESDKQNTNDLLEKCKGEMVQLNEVIVRLSSQRSTETATNQELLRQATLTITEVSNRLKAESSTARALKAENAKVLSEVESLRNRCSDYEGKLQVCEDKLRQKDEEFQQMQHKLASLVADLESKMVHCNKLRVELDAAKKHYEDAQLAADMNRSSVKNVDKEGLELHCSKLRAKLQLARADLQDSRHRVFQLRYQREYLANVLADYQHAEREIVHYLRRERISCPPSLLDYTSMGSPPNQRLSPLQRFRAAVYASIATLRFWRKIVRRQEKLQERQRCLDIISASSSVQEQDDDDLVDGPRQSENDSHRQQHVAPPLITLNTSSPLPKSNDANLQRRHKKELVNRNRLYPATKKLPPRRQEDVEAAKFLNFSSDSLFEDRPVKLSSTCLHDGSGRHGNLFDHADMVTPIPANGFHNTGRDLFEDQTSDSILMAPIASAKNEANGGFHFSRPDSRASVSMYPLDSHAITRETIKHNITVDPNSFANAATSCANQDATSATLSPRSTNRLVDNHSLAKSARRSEAQAYSSLTDLTNLSNGHRFIKAATQNSN